MPTLFSVITLPTTQKINNWYICTWKRLRVHWICISLMYAIVFGKNPICNCLDLFWKCWILLLCFLIVYDFHDFFVFTQTCYALSKVLHVFDTIMIFWYVLVFTINRSVHKRTLEGDGEKPRATQMRDDPLTFSLFLIYDGRKPKARISEIVDSTASRASEFAKGQE